MKKFICLAISLLTLPLTPVFGQPVTAQPPGGTFQTRLQQIIEKANVATNQPVLTKFNLDFPGGTPAELVKAIQKATGKPLNAIISTEDADIQLPPLKMNDVVTPQLFTAMEVASRKTVALQNVNFPNSYSQFTADYGFKTADGPISDTSIWYFHAEKPIVSPVISEAKVCRFYLLEPYLDRGFTVDDITTAIQTGWKMMGEKETPEISFHKETKLLIAVGEPDKLAVIDNVLNALAQSKFKPAPLIDSTTGLPLPKADSKAGQ